METLFNTLNNPELEEKRKEELDLYLNFGRKQIIVFFENRFARDAL